VARRTWEQKTIITNNLAIRRATDELARAESLEQICEILKLAFHDHDFDGFEFSFSPELPGWHGVLELSAPVQYEWHRETQTSRKGWVLRLDLLSPEGRVCGAFSVDRSYAARSLRSDVDCLTDGFATTLSAALQRTCQSHTSIPAMSVLSDKTLLNGATSVA
jgi:hypothetical protein